MGSFRSELVSRSMAMSLYRNDILSQSKVKGFAMIDTDPRHTGVLYVRVAVDYPRVVCRAEILVDAP